MRYALIREMDISNGTGIGISLFVQGCHFHCKGCFNPETWDFNGGKVWNKVIEEKFFDLASRPWVKRISFLGGEPLADENVETVYRLVRKLYETFPDKKIWTYTGFCFEDILNDTPDEICGKDDEIKEYRYRVVANADVLVDGRYEVDKKDLSLPFRGSTNQRLIDVQKSMENGTVVLYDIESEAI